VTRRQLTPAREVHARLADWNAASAEPEPWVITTSGSTGQAKRVKLSRRAMRASADATHARLGGPGQWLLALPPSYVAGTQVLLRSVLADTEPVFLDEHDDLAGAVGRMTGERRYLSLVPTQLARDLTSSADVAALQDLDAVLVGGANLDHDLRATAERHGIRVVATYGMTETCGGCAYDGIPLDGVQVAVSTEGRVSLAGEVLFDGYDGPSEQTAHVMRDGWFVTDDMGRLDEHGRLEVLGRIDDVVLSGGVNVPSSAVARRLREHDEVVDAAVVGVPDPEWGQVVVAVVTGDEVSLEELRDFVSSRHPRAWAPRRVVNVDAIPLLDNGKVDRMAMERLARES